jgi:hypothetical protein
MKFDFSGFKAPEGFPVEALNNPELNAFLDLASDKQLEVHKADYDERLNKLTRDKAISDDKLSGLQSKLDDAIKAGSGNDDIDKIKAQLSRAKEEAALEYRGQIDALKKEKDDLLAENDKTKQALSDTELRHYLRSGLSEYNAKFESVKIRDGGAEDFLIEKAMKDWKKTQSGEYKAYNSDETPITSADGAITRADYFAGLRDKPETSFCFNQPTGGGATGGKGGAGENWGQYYDPKTINLTKQAQLARENPTLHSQLSAKKR